MLQIALDGDLHMEISNVETEREGKPLKLTEAEVTYVAIKLPEREPAPLQGPQDGGLS